MEHILELAVLLIAAAVGAIARWTVKVQNKVIKHDELHTMTSEELKRVEKCVDNLSSELSHQMEGCALRTANYTRIQAAMEFMMKNQEEMKGDIKELAKKLDTMIFRKYGKED